MAGTSLLALIDDIATLLDDVAVLSKTAASKTVGVLGDDLALNAEQVTGVRAERELPVIWAVAKGSALNKLILVPGALALSYFVPWLIVPFLMLGGAFLCFEGAEKLAERWLHHPEPGEHQLKLDAITDPSVDLVAFEKEKIKGAIRTDFILSAEIVVIALGTVLSEPFLTRALVVSALAAGITVFVYALVAGIVKLDDLGLRLQAGSSQESPTAKARLGQGLLWFAPRLLKALNIVGTAAMFLVGGGILVHGIPPVAGAIHGAEHAADALPGAGAILGPLASMAMSGAFGILAGALLVGLHTVATKFRSPS